jgi:hypothetical protein
MSMKNFLEDIGVNAENLTLYKMLVAMVVFIMPVVWMIIGIGVLAFFDIFTALLAAKKNRIPITSNRLSKSVYKLLVYNVLIITSLIADKITNLNIFVTVTGYFLVLIEVYSIGENINKILGINFIHYLKNYLEDKVKNIK